MDDSEMEVKLFPERERLVVALAENINKSKGPVTLAIDASWGEGKTTFVSKLADVLEESSVRVARFDAFEETYRREFKSQVQLI